MEKGYIAPEAALKKLRAAKGLGQTVYIYGATGYGKTELIRQYLSRRRHCYISCAEDAAGLTEAAQSAWKEKEGEPRSVVVADDLHLLKDAQGRRAVHTLAGRQDIWLILICRSPIPAWLMPLYIKGGFLVIAEDDLRLGEKETAAYMESQGLTLTEEELAFVTEKSQGNAYTVRHTALKMLEGRHPGPELAQEITEAFAAYLESHVMVQWDSDLLEFLMQVSVTNEFTLPLAEMATGNRHAPELLERAMETGNFLSCKDGTYRLRPELIRALRRRAAKEYSPRRGRTMPTTRGFITRCRGRSCLPWPCSSSAGRKSGSGNS